MNLVLESGTSLTLKVGGNFINLNPAGVFIQGTMVMINSGGAAGAGAGASPQPPTAPKEADQGGTRSHYRIASEEETAHADEIQSGGIGAERSCAEWVAFL